MKANGFCFSAEAAVSMLLLGALLALPEPAAQSALPDLLVFQKENDLLKIWQKNGLPLSESEIAGDLEFFFPGKNAAAIIDGRETMLGEKTANAISSETVFFDGSMRQHRIQLTIFR